MALISQITQVDSATRPGPMCEISVIPRAPPSVVRPAFVPPRGDPYQFPVVGALYG
jgi:hypothetical protein